MRSVASLTPLRADISRMVMPGSGADDGTASTVAQEAADEQVVETYLSSA
jgi:hypothetical protein